MHQYSGVKKGYRPARTSRGYRSECPLQKNQDPREEFYQRRKRTALSGAGNRTAASGVAWSG